MNKNLLKQLDLQGYKTFASKTIFEFPGRVTAIVGPNGSGKSNIADAIRWVLGEQAYSLLRGKKTEDMIFFGSETRSRASMASSSITFDNVSGWLPVDFSEVTITRRAYRSGENEYLINNQKVRLKDIDELLANSGLGERTYTIIGQGLVDSALSQRPEDRRRFFEEAAGIGLYKGRREDAIRKLEKTNRNITRVLDIQNELTPRVKKLEKSLGKTRQYNLIHANLENMLKDWYGYQLNQARRLLDDSTQFYKSQKETFNKKLEDREIIESKVHGIQNSINLNRDKLANAHKKLAEMHSRGEVLNRENAVLDERKKSLESRILDLKSSLVVQEGKLERESAVCEELKGKRISLEINQGEVTKQLDLAEKDLQKSIENSKRVEKELALLRIQMQEIEKNNITIDPQIKILGSNIDRNGNEIEQINKNIGLKKDGLESEEKILDRDEQLLKSIKTSLKRNKAELSELQTSELDLQKQIFERKENLSKINTESTRIETQLAVILEEDKKQSNTASGSGQLISAARNKKIQGKIIPLLQFVDILQKYETAVAAALGSILDGVIISESADPLKILEFITQNQSQRTILIPEHWINDNNEDFALPDHMKLASDLIEGQNEEAGIIRNLLKRTIIVKDCKEAVQKRDLLKPGWKIVTLNGELFDFQGFIAAGIEKHSAPLQRKRTKKEFDSEKVELDSSINQLNSLLNQLAKDEGKLAKQIQEIDSLIVKDERTERELSLNIFKQKIQIEQSERDIEIFRNKKIELAEQIKIFQQEKKSLKESKEELQKKLSLKNSEVEQIEKKVDHTRINESRVISSDLSSRKAVLSQVLQQHNQNLENHKSEVKEITGLVDDTRRKTGQLESGIKDIDLQKSKLQKESISIRKRIKELNDAIKPLEEDVDQIIGRQGKILNTLDAKRRAFSIAERHTLQAQMKVEKARDKLDTIQVKIQDDIGFILPAAESEFTSANPLPFDELIAGLPDVKELPERLEEEIRHQRSLLRRLGPVNPEAEKEYNDVNKRVIFLEQQTGDLDEAEKGLRKIIEELDAIMKKEFLKTFNNVQKEFKHIFGQLFNGGEVELYIADPDELFNSGIEIEVTLPGKRKQELALLSGGEKSLTGVALIFALLRISPTPFCVLDEVDAMLDESNIARFGILLRELSEFTQFIVITHNRNTVQLADVLYGVTMGKDSVSQVISLKMDQLTDEMVS